MSVTTKSTTQTTYMAIDQYGTTYHNLGTHPRQSLLQRLYRTKAAKMYVDTTDGQARHVGYIIAHLWIRLYHVEPFAGRA